MTYSEIAEVRLEAGGYDPADLTDADILEDIEAADAIITNATKHDWVDTDPSWQLVRKISKLLASSFSMDRFDDPQGEGEKNFEKGMILLDMLTGTDEISDDMIVLVSDYKTRPLNPNAPIYRGRLAEPLNKTVSVDPDDIYGQDI